MSTDIGEFHDQFNASVRRISALKDADTKKQQILELKAQVEGISHLLPSYQQLSYSDSIRTLLTSMARPKRTFKFSSRVRQSRTSAGANATPCQKTFEEDSVVIKPTLDNVHDQHLILHDATVLVTNATRCKLNITQASTVTLRNIESCTMVINSTGSVFVQEASACTLFITCHQLRIHDAKDCKIIATIPSGRAVIEGCNGLQVQGVEIDDFDCPNGQSTNFETIIFDDQTMASRQQVLQK